MFIGCTSGPSNNEARILSTVTVTYVPHLRAYIPEHKLDGLEYGAHVSMVGGAGYHIRPEGTHHWYVARMAPLSPGDDADTLQNILDEIADLAS